jgi:hypothetical protein
VRSLVEEWIAAAVLTLATAFFWWRGFRTFTIGGAILFVVALLLLGLHRRRTREARTVGDTRSTSAAEIVATLLAALIFPALVAFRSAGAAPSLVNLASADVWFGAFLYGLGLMELVELATLRALDEPP